MSNNPLTDPTGFMKWKQRMFKFKGKPFDLMNSKKISHWSGRSDLVQTITPPLGDLVVCHECLRKFQYIDDDLKLERIAFALSGKCVFCKRDVLYLQSKGIPLYRIKSINLTLDEIWRYLGGQKSKSAKYAGSRLW